MNLLCLRSAAIEVLGVARRPCYRIPGELRSAALRPTLSGGLPFSNVEILFVESSRNRHTSYSRNANGLIPRDNFAIGGSFKTEEKFYWPRNFRALNNFVKLTTTGGSWRDLAVLGRSRRSQGKWRDLTWGNLKAKSCQIDYVSVCDLVIESPTATQLASIFLRSWPARKN